MAFLQTVGAFFGNYFDLVSRLPQLYREDMPTFWKVAGSLLLILLVLVLLITALARKKRPKREKEEDTRRFVAVVNHEPDMDGILLPLDERILSSQKRLSPDLVRRIKSKGPDALGAIVSAYKRATPDIQSHLAQLVWEEHLMERYSMLLVKDEYPQGVLVDAYRYFPRESVLRGFIEMLAHRDEAVQMAAVRLLSVLQEPKSLSMLVMALVQPDRYVPARVAEVFCAMPMQSAKLLVYMLPEVDERHWEILLDIVAQTEKPFDPGNTLPCLKHQNPKVRMAAVNALGAGRCLSVLPQLLLLADDKDWRVRAAVAKALGRMGDPRSTAILEVLAKDTESWVAEYAEEALAALETPAESNGAAGA